MQQQSFLTQIRTGSNPPCTEEYELSSQTTSNKVEGKDAIVLHLPDGGTSTTDSLMVLEYSMIVVVENS
jgi:hypothetical protein